MEWAILVLLVFIILLQFAARWQQQRDVERILEVVRKWAPHQGEIAANRSSFRIPRVDANARTTQREYDLPATGRMSQGIKRVKRETPHGIDSDS